MPKFRKVPIIIEAERLIESVEIQTLKGTLIGNAGDWLITGIEGEQYPCKHEIFVQTYEPADEEALLYFEDHQDGTFMPAEDFQFTVNGQKWPRHGGKGVYLFSICFRQGEDIQCLRKMVEAESREEAKAICQQANDAIMGTEHRIIALLNLVKKGWR